jgi:hypothetical protein
VEQQLPPELRFSFEGFPTGAIYLVMKKLFLITILMSFAVASQAADGCPASASCASKQKSACCSKVDQKKMSTSKATKSGCGKCALAKKSILSPKAKSLASK